MKQKTVIVYSGIICVLMLCVAPSVVSAHNTFPSYTQDGFWFLDDDASSANAEDETGFGAGNTAENTAITGVAKETVFQIRIDVSETANQDQNQNLIWTLQYKAQTGSESCSDTSGWTQITTGSGNAFQIVSAASITEPAEADLDRITTDTKPQDPLEGALLDASNSHTSLLDNKSSETQWAIQTTTNASDSQEYLLRVSDNNAQGGLNSYTQCPSITTAAAVSAPTVSTNAASGVTASGATLNGTISDTGGDDATQHGFAYGTDSTLATVIATTTLGAKTGTGTFNEVVSTLDAETTYYFRAYATNSAGTGYGSILNFTTSAASLTFIVSTNTFPDVTPGTAVFATTTLSIDTDNANGWNVTVSRDDGDTTLDLNTDASVNIADQTAWSAPGATTSAGNAVRIASFDNSGDVLAFRVMTASGSTPFITSTWWGSADAYVDNVNTLWAGLPATAQKIGDSSVSCSGASCALNTVLYYLDVYTTQDVGVYSGSITFTATMN